MAPKLTPKIHVHRSCKWGLHFQVHDKESESVYNTTLTVNATKAVNNTNVYCVFESHLGTSNHSLNATLMIITGRILFYLLCNNYNATFRQKGVVGNIHFPEYLMVKQWFPL
jgi:hypothetical protein